MKGIIKLDLLQGFVLDYIECIRLSIQCIYCIINWLIVLCIINQHLDNRPIGP